MLSKGVPLGTGIDAFPQADEHEETMELTLEITDEKPDVMASIVEAVSSIETSIRLQSSLSANVDNISSQYVSSLVLKSHAVLPKISIIGI